MSKKAEKIYVLEISLDDINPRIWRKVEVPSTFTFYQLHLTIIGAMDGWSGGHQHEFEYYVGNSPVYKRIGNAAFDFIDDDPMIDENKAKICDYIPKYKNMFYVYDMGDNWEHRITLLEEIEPKKNTIYPRCVDGKRACPPEDCGSYPGYEDLCEKLAGPNCPEKRELKEWLGRPYNPDRFNVKNVVFPPGLCKRY